MIWKPATRVMIPAGSPVGAQCIKLNTSTGVFLGCGVKGPMPSPHAWHPLDLTLLGVPADAVAVDIRGLLIITGAAYAGAWDLAVAFQPPGAGTNLDNFDMQAVAVGSGGGARTNGSVIVGCIGGKIEWAWLRGDGYKSAFPNGPLYGESYGLSLTVQAVFMP